LFFTIFTAMRKIIISLFFLVTVCASAQDAMTLWYSKPAANWNEALPVGNGRLGAMVFGRVDEEILQLNEETLWSGGPVNTNPNPLAPGYLPQVREALFKEDYELADKLARQLHGLYTQAYEPLGDLSIRHNFKSSSPVENYYRDLNIGNATSTTRFTRDNVTYTREVFVTAPDQVIVIRLTASQKGALDFVVRTSSQLWYSTGKENNDVLTLNGRAPSASDPSYLQTRIPIIYNDQQQCRGMRFSLKVKTAATDGRVSLDDNGLHISDASEALIIVSAATSFNGYDKCPDKEGRDENALANQYLNNAVPKTYAVLHSAHVSDYQQYFNRVSLFLGTTKEKLPINERLKRYAEGALDPELEVLYFQYGRYLLISSSRPGGIPANLQGIWNHHVRPPWSSNFTTNINTEMNYWMAESCNLSELHQPLFDLVKNVAVTGKQTTKNFYNASGWTLHHNTDIWATSNPMSGNPQWANWPMGAGWVCQHLWEHYQFTGDRKFLEQTAYPLMKGAVEFYLQWLVEKDGLLVTAPSTSPENEFITDKGFKGSVSVATTMDVSIIWDLFTNIIHASNQLGVDSELRQQLIEKRSKLYPLKIGKRGNLQEWYKDWEDADPNHRHISHLFGLFPGRQISPFSTPDYAKAVRQSMDLRGDGGTGWSKGWKINIWARLQDGNRAYKLIHEQLKLTGVEGTNYANGGGTYPNLLDAHPPFQIDGNFGGTSGMTEMLLQSHDEILQLLPALPDQWSTGSVQGLKARGGYTVDIEWANKVISEVKIQSTLGNIVRIASKTPLKGKNLTMMSGKNSNPFYQSVFINEDKSQRAGAGLFIYDLKTEAGKEYILLKR
jgi:alpha-L-fucosidase 2